MKFHENIIEDAKGNNFFRKVLATGKNSQVVLMSIPPENEIGEEVHGSTDQILVFVEGKGEAIIEEEVSEVMEGDLVFVPAGTLHNFKNTSEIDLKLFTIYAPPEHQPGTVQETKEETMPETENKATIGEKMNLETEKETVDVANWNIS